MALGKINKNEKMLASQLKIYGQVKTPILYKSKHQKIRNNLGSNKLCGG